MTNELTKEKLRELDAWIAEHVFGYKHNCIFEPTGAEGVICANCNHHVSFEAHDFPHYTTDPAASDALDDAILKRVGDDGYAIDTLNGIVRMVACITGIDAVATHHDKKICRALFAQKLFTKDNQ